MNETVNHAPQKESEDGGDNNYQKIYGSIARTSVNDKIHIRYFIDSSQLTYWILGSGAMCHMTPQISDFISC